MSKPLLQLKDASIFQQENLVLSDISLDIFEGDFMYLIGKTGSGKSSLMKTLYGDLPLLKGEGVIVDFNLNKLKEKDVAKMDAKINEVLEKVGMQTKGFKMAYQLSGGEQQRVAIARALLNDPDLILADEPTGNLDPKTSLEVMSVLEEINKSGKTILMATHDYALILKYPHKTIKCDGEKVYEVV